MAVTLLPSLFHIMHLTSKQSIHWSRIRVTTSPSSVPPTSHNTHSAGHSSKKRETHIYTEEEFGTHWLTSPLDISRPIMNAGFSTSRSVPGMRARKRTSSLFLRAQPPTPANLPQHRPLPVTPVILRAVLLSAPVP